MIFGVRAVVDDGAHSFYLLVDDVFKFPRGAKYIVVVGFEICLLTFAHFGYSIKEFSCIHFLV